MRVRLPNPAGYLQDHGPETRDDLIAEIATNYDRYHAYLADELEAFAGRPEPEDFENIFEFMSASQAFVDLVAAEVALRRCVAVTGGDHSAKNLPLLDANHRLVSLRSNNVLRDQPSWSPVPMPWLRSTETPTPDEG